MKVSYILLLSVSATMQVFASKVASPNMQSASEVASNRGIGVGRRYLQDPKELLESSPAHVVDSPLGEHPENQARAAENKAKPAKSTPVKGALAIDRPAKPTPAKSTPAGKCKRQVTVNSASGQGKPAKGKPAGKGKVIRRTYADFLIASQSQKQPAKFRTVASRG